MLRANLNIPFQKPDTMFYSFEKWADYDKKSIGSDFKIHVFYFKREYEATLDRVYFLKKLIKNSGLQKPNKQKATLQNCQLEPLIAEMFPCNIFLK